MPAPQQRGPRTSKLVPFPDWTPDAPTLGGAQVMRNVIPGEGAYRPFPAFDALDDSSQSIAEDFTEAFVAWAGDGAVDVIAATSAALYRWDGDSWVSILGSLTDGEWRFAQWGDEWLGMNPTHGLYYSDIGGTPAAESAAPAARFIARIDNHVFLGGLNGYPNAAQWSGFNDRTDWGTTDTDTGDTHSNATVDNIGSTAGWAAGMVITGSGIQAATRIKSVDSATAVTLSQNATATAAGVALTVYQPARIATGAGLNYFQREYGALTGIKGGTVETAVIFQERAISVMSRDPDFVFAFNIVEEELGCAASRSIQSYGPLTFFVSQEGPAVFDGRRARLLGENKFRRWFQDAADGVTQTPIYSAIDKRNKVVLWYWMPDGGSPVAQGLIYNWAEDRASEWRPGVAYPLVFSLPASIADTNVLTATAIGSYQGDALQTRLSGVADRPRLAENTLIIGSIDPTTDQLGRFNGSAMEATMETAEWVAPPSGQNAASPTSDISQLKVVIDAPAASTYATISSRKSSMGDTPVDTAERQGHALGHVPVIAQGLSHKASVRILAATSWKHAQGVQFTYTEGGEA